MAVNPPRKCKGMLKAFPKARKHSYLCVEKSRFRPTRRNRVEGPFAGCPSHTAWPRDWASSNMPFGIRRFSNMNEGCYLISSREDSLLRRKKSSGYALCMVFVTDILQAPDPSPVAFLASAMGIPIAEARKATGDGSGAWRMSVTKTMHKAYPLDFFRRNKLSSLLEMR